MTPERLSSDPRPLLVKGQLKKLVRLGPACLPAIRRALWDDRWRVRRNALRVLDHLDDGGSTSRMIELLADEHEEVRKWAAHSLGCERCKDGGEKGVDPVPHLIDVARRDSSAAVRRSAVVCLAWNRPQDERIRLFLEERCASEPDPQIVRHAWDGLNRHSAPTSAVGSLAT